jgi:hypothetical protein
VSKRMDTQFCSLLFFWWGEKSLGPEHSCLFSLLCFVWPRYGYFVYAMGLGQGDPVFREREVL